MTGNHMIDDDDGSHPFSPNYIEPIEPDDEYYPEDDTDLNEDNN